ncbi:hypothetical protein D5086_008706 [Populus alba]|uniref:Uncharacterized protein n=1 Tax=Populus alba TaxID=43335 RepID=A0ACC4CHQ4_POPAL
MKMKMGLSPDSVKVKNFKEKSKSKKNKKNQGNEKDEEDIGCWFKFRSTGSCMPSRSKVDSSLSGISTHYVPSKSKNEKNKDQPVVPAMSSTTTTSNAESASSLPTFSWIEENGTAPVKPGTGLTVAVKTLNHDGLQGHKEWLV